MEEGGVKLRISSPPFKGGGRVLSQHSAPGIRVVQEERKKGCFSAPHKSLKEGEGGKEGNGVHASFTHHVNDVFLCLLVGAKAEGKGENISYHAHVITMETILEEMLFGEVEGLVKGLFKGSRIAIGRQESTSAISLANATASK